MRAGLASLTELELRPVIAEALHAAVSGLHLKCLPSLLPWQAIRLSKRYVMSTWS